MGTMSSMNFKELRARMEKVAICFHILLLKVIRRLEQLLDRVNEKTELAIFLTDITENFQFDLLTDVEDLKTITTEDKLLALEESERWVLQRGNTVLNYKEPFSALNSSSFVVFICPFLHSFFPLRGKLCSQSFKRLRRRGLEVDLGIIMVRCLLIESTLLVMN